VDITNKKGKPVGLKRPTIYTGGTFDLFHAGHAAFLERCHELGDVIVALNTDEFIVEYKGKAPVMTYSERAAVLLSSKWVTAVVPNMGGADSKPTIEQVQPDYVVIGSDWARRDYYYQMGFDQDWLDVHGIGLVYIPYTDGISTTAIKARLTNG
jgi:glycerol-3-phosphate cytidylyltransferase